MATIIERYDREGNLIGFRAAVRRKGHPSQVRTFRRRTEAEVWARDLESKMDRGVFQDLRESERTTLRQLLERYRREVTPDKRGADIESVKIGVLLRYPIVERPVAGLRGSDFAAWRDHRIAEVSADTVRRELTILRSVFSVAMKEWNMALPAGNPVSTLRWPRAGESRTRRLEPGEEERLLAAAADYEHTKKALRMVGIIRLAISTAMRRGEIAAMRWEHVNLVGRSLLIQRTKNGDARTIPLARSAVEVLDALPRRIDGWIWGANLDPHSITTAFDRITARAGIADLRFHDLRHEAVSRLFEDTDLDLLEIARISGHKTLSSLNKYAHLRTGRLADRLDGCRRGEVT